DAGSSTDSASDVYRGTAPFSEPETQAVRDFCIQHQFKIALNYHAFSNLLIIPWGFDNTLTTDDASYRALGNKMTEQNNYLIGTGLETVGYLVNGDSDDWMYGEQTTKPKILSMTPEVGPGSFGFWPPANAIDGLNKENLWQNLSAAGLLKAYGEVVDLNPARLENAQGTLNFNFQNIGLESGTFTVHIQSTNPDLLITSEPITATLNHLDSTPFSIAYEIINATTLFQKFDFEVIINNGAIERKSTLTKEYFSTSFNNLFLDAITDSSVVNWTITNGWGLTDQTFFSANHSFTDSPTGNYPDNHISFIELNESVDLQNAAAAMLRFQGKWALETNYDYVQLFISTNQTDYTPLCGNFTVTNGAGEPAYNGIQENWVLEEIDLSDYIGQEVTFRFELRSDEFVNADGFYFDEFGVDIIANDAGTTSIPEPAPFVENRMQITPNPFSDNFTISFDLVKKTTDLTLRLLNTLGQEVAIQPLGDLNKGNHTITWKNIELKNGFYFLQLQDGQQQSVSQKVLKLE
ncbi:MAG: M14 family zinc carboxypeptidase, partial [Saprospiraceae bacterium]